MAEKIPDLWPDDIIVSNMRVPAMILRQQAALLGQKTQNIVEGEVTSTVDQRYADRQYIGQEPSFIHNFNLIAPALGNYRFRLFYIAHSQDIYPVTIYVSKEGEGALTVESEEELIKALKDIFSSEKTKQMIRALIAHSEGSS